MRVNMDNYYKLLATLTKKLPNTAYGPEGSAYLHRVDLTGGKPINMGLILKADAPVKSGPAEGQIIPHLRPGPSGAHGRGVYMWNDRPDNVYFNPRITGAASDEGFVFDRDAIGDAYGRKRAKPPLSGDAGLNYKAMTLFHEPVRFERGGLDYAVLSRRGNLNSRAAAKFVERTGITPVTTQQFHSALQNAHWKSAIEGQLRGGKDLDEALEFAVKQGLRPRDPGAMTYFKGELGGSGSTVDDIIKDLMRRGEDIRKPVSEVLPD